MKKIVNVIFLMFFLLTGFVINSFGQNTTSVLKYSTTATWYNAQGCAGWSQGSVKANASGIITTTGNCSIGLCSRTLSGVIVDAFSTDIMLELITPRFIGNFPTAPSLSFYGTISGTSTIKIGLFYIPYLGLFHTSICNGTFSPKTVYFQ